MKIMTIFVSLFLSWAAYDQNLFRRRRESFSHGSIEFVLSESELEEKKQVQQHLSVIPPWHRSLPKRVRLRVNYFSTKPRDVRFSNQRKIRRMFNNM